jgi:hypothetical protein
VTLTSLEASIADKEQWGRPTEEYAAQASRARLRILARTRKVNKTKTLILMVAVILAGFGTASLGAAVLMLVV